MAERAHSLGVAGTRLQAALDALAAVDAGAPSPKGATRASLVDDAAERAWEYVIVRGAQGWHDEDAALRTYAVPREVRQRIGARRPRAG